MRTSALTPLLLAGALTAQDRAAKWRPVPELAAPEPLPVTLPRARSQDVGAGAVFHARAANRSVLWMQDGKLSDAPLPPRALGDAPRELDFGNEPPHSLQVGDFDGDGRVEVIVRGLGLGNPHVHLDEPEVVVKDARRLFGPDRDGPWFSGCAFDWFGDGHCSLLLVEDSRVLARRNPLTKQDTVVLVDLGAANVPNGTTFVGTAGDFDLDGMPDLVLALPERGLAWCRNEGTRTEPRFSAPIPLWPATRGVLVTSVLLFPIDDDPWPDVVVGTAEPAYGQRGDFQVREPRVRTEAQEIALRALEADTSRDGDSTVPRLPGNLVPGNESANPFAKLLAARQRADRIDALRWRVVEMVARPAVVHYRVRRR